MAAWIELRNNQTGEVRRYRDVYFDAEEEYSDYGWTEGNYSCDCNRSLFFARAIGEEPEEMADCGETMFTAIRAICDSGKIVPLDAPTGGPPMTSARDKAIEALARMMWGLPNWKGYTRSEQEYRTGFAEIAFNANHPALVWDETGCWSRPYYIFPKSDGTFKLEHDDDSGFAEHLGVFATPAAAQAAADDHYIAQRLAGTKLWEQMEEMG